MRKQRKKFEKPSHPWQKARLDEESVIVKEYGLKSKRELWKMQSKLKHFTSQVKHFATMADETAAKQRNLLLAGLASLGLLKENSNVDDVLNLGLKDILERRLQTIVFRKGLAKSIKQARQFITHNHVEIGERIVSVPSYLVKNREEPAVTIAGKSSLSRPDHPERIVEKKAEKRVKRSREKPKRKRFERK